MISKLFFGEDSGIKMENCERTSGCTITSKAKINVFLKKFQTERPPKGPSERRKNFKKEFVF